jgi:hypothetical protein
VLVVAIGGWPVRITANEPSFLDLINRRYANFVSHDAEDVKLALRVDLAESRRSEPDDRPDDDVRVVRQQGKWSIQRSDFQAVWNPNGQTACIRQTANPYSLDSLLRIVHTLALAGDGGVLLHAARVIRSRRAYLFAGLSGAGKSTIAGLTPADATLLTDEISFVRRNQDTYVAYGTPFTGEVNRSGSNDSAPLGAIYFLRHGRQNVLERADAGAASRLLLRHVLFFATEADLVRRVFNSVCDCVVKTPVYWLTFVPDARVWELIQ